LTTGRRDHVDITVVHRKYGNPLDCATRFGAALGVARLQ